VGDRRGDQQFGVFARRRPPHPLLAGPNCERRRPAKRVAPRLPRGPVSRSPVEGSMPRGSESSKGERPPSVRFRIRRRTSTSITEGRSRMVFRTLENQGRGPSVGIRPSLNNENHPPPRRAPVHKSTGARTCDKPRASPLCERELPRTVPPRHGRRRRLVIQGRDCGYVLLRNVPNPWRPAGRVGRWRGGRRLRLGCIRRFRLRARLGVARAPFPAPPHRTVREVLPHTALREPSPDGVQRT
jgi:hypothetical protein